MRMTGPMLAPDGAAGAGGAGGAGSAVSESKPPDKFKLNGQLVTLAEAEKLLTDAAAAAAENTTLKQHLGKFQKFYEHTKSAMNGQDENSYRIVAKAIGWTDDRVDRAIEAMNKIRSGKAVAMEEDEDDEEDFDDPVDMHESRASRNGNGRVRHGGVDAALDQRLRVIEKFMHDSRDYMDKMGSSVNTQFDRTVEQETLRALRDDPMLSKVMNARLKANPGGYKRVVAAALEVAKKEARSSGFSEAVLDKAKATARSWADDFGWFTAETPPATPGVGGMPPDLVGMSTYKASGKSFDTLLEEFDPTAENHAEQLGMLLASAIPDESR